MREDGYKLVFSYIPAIPAGIVISASHIVNTTKDTSQQTWLFLLVIITMLYIYIYNDGLVLFFLLEPLFMCALLQYVYIIAWWPNTRAGSIAPALLIWPPAAGHTKRIDSSRLKKRKDSSFFSRETNVQQQDFLTNLLLFYFMSIMKKFPPIHTFDSVHFAAKHLLSDEGSHFSFVSSSSAFCQGRKKEGSSCI